MESHLIRKAAGTPPPPPLPSGPGGYALVIRLDEERTLRVGRLGRIEFPAGLYVYLGSALGGLAPRIRRHLRRRKKRHWHIDALTAAARPTEVWLAESETRVECAWARAALDTAGASAPAPRFGASDCRCRSHLVRLPGEAALTDLYDVLAGPHLSGRLRRITTGRPRPRHRAATPGR